MSQLIRSLVLLILIIQQAHAAALDDGLDGRWQLTIRGHDQLEFGTEHLAGGVLIDWISVLDFTIENGQFLVGSGTAQLLPGMTAVSRPAEVFECEQENGIFASNSGQSFSTPHLRYSAFPMVGRVRNNKVQLMPHLEYPGNYYALLYKCVTEDSLGSFWLDNSPRYARELSKRQNASMSTGDSRFSARIKEVKNIPPGPELILPLVDGLEFSLTQEHGMRKLDYSLRRISSPESEERKSGS